ncbi:MAG: M81 family metallopeptidase [Trueperaceae bacterium]
MRIGLIGLHLETAVRNPLPSTAASFRVHRGQAVSSALAADEVRALLGGDPPEFEPIWYARSRPGGRLDRADAERLLDEMRAALAATGPLDGLLLAQHGGLRVAESRDDAPDRSPTDGEARVVTACREVLGAGVPIVACYDPHGDPGDHALAMLDGACAFRTAPHVDVVQTRARAIRLLVRIARDGLRPCARLVRGSLVLPGALAEGPGPGSEAFGAAADMSDLPGVLDASWLPASPWTDRPDERSGERRDERHGDRPDERSGAGAGFLVVAEDERTALRAAHDANAQVQRNAARFRFHDRLIAVGEGARRAAPGSPGSGAASLSATTLLLDAGDAIGAGAVGDRWEVALALVDAGARDALFAGVVAPALVARCRAAGDGATLLATVGPELAPGDAQDERGRQDAGEARHVELRVERASLDLAAFASADDVDAPPPAQGEGALVTLGGVRVLIRSTRRELASWAQLAPFVGPLTRWRTVVVKATRRPAGFPADTDAWTLASPGATDHRVGVAEGSRSLGRLAGETRTDVHSE